jgi:hypothetical protein
MSLRSFLQNHPTPYVWMWELTSRILKRTKPLIERVGVERSSRIFEPFEAVGKHLAFDCRDCGQCALHYAGMTCPMTCPKTLRNGPCGGVRLNGKCEVKPEMDCVWVKAYERSLHTPYKHEMFRLNPPVDWRLQGMASWVTYATGQDQIATGSDLIPRYADEVIKPS